MTPERHRRLCAALDRRQPDLSVILEGVHKPHNINAIVRTCDAVGVLDVHAVLPENRARASASSAMGSQRWVYVHEHDSGPEAVAAARAQELDRQQRALQPAGLGRVRCLHRADELDKEAVLRADDDVAAVGQHQRRGFPHLDLLTNLTNKIELKSN